MSTSQLQQGRGQVNDQWLSGLAGWLSSAPVGKHGVQKPLFHDGQQVDGQALNHSALLCGIRLAQDCCQALRRLVLHTRCNVITLFRVPKPSLASQSLRGPVRRLDLHRECNVM